MLDMGNVSLEGCEGISLLCGEKERISVVRQQIRFPSPSWKVGCWVSSFSAPWLSSLPDKIGVTVYLPLGYRWNLRAYSQQPTVLSQMVVTRIRRQMEFLMTGDTKAREERQ
jgi:hypothetical protein